MALEKDGQLHFSIDEQRAQVAGRMHYDLHIGLRGILGADMADPGKRLAEANAVIEVLRAQVNKP